jgi:TolA-binding protein
MKTNLRTVVILSLLGFLAGCGVNEQKHKEVVSQLADAKQELAGINSESEKATQDQTDAEAKMEAGKRKIASLKKQVANLKTDGEGLDAKIAELQTKEAYVFQSAGASLDAQDFQGALQAYQNFVAKFPQSSRVGKANEIIASLQSKSGIGSH